MGGVKVARASISQETFNEAVASNKADLGMEDDEALEAAIEEFQMQGIDLSSIVTKSGAASDPVPELVEQLQLAVDNLSGSEAILEAVSKLCRHLSGLKKDELLQSTLGQKQLVELLLQSLLILKQTDSSVLETLQTVKLVLTNDATRAQFGASKGPEQILQCIQNPQGDDDLQAALTAIEAAATKCEDNKCAFMDLEVGETFCQILSGSSASEPVIKAVSKCVLRLTTADDDRPIVSRAFQNSRSLSKAGLHLHFLTRLKQQELPGPSFAAACCSALKKLVANDELCKEVADAGAVELTLKILAQHVGSADSSRAAAAFLRQMAGNDAIKSQIVDGGGLHTVRSVLEAQRNSAAVMEQALGLVAAVTLRYPEAADEAVKVGIPELIVEVMQANSNQWVQRQACMATRNLVARTPQHRQGLVEMGIQEGIQDAQKAFPQACTDVGDAALRDLGLK